VQEKNPRSGLLQSAVVTSFCTYLVYSSLVSQPASMACTTLRIDPQSPGAVTTILIGVAFTFLAVIYSAVSTSTSNKITDETTGLVNTEKNTDQNKKSVEEGDVTPTKLEDEDAPVPYNYSFFHVTFSLAAMYLGMVLTNWAVVSDTEVTVHVDQGMAAVWIKMISSWLTMGLYTWTVIAPLVLKNRSFV